MEYKNGKIKVPSGPGLGIEVDRDKLQKYADLYEELGGYSYDRDPHRPEWYGVLPEDKWAIPKDKA